MSYPNGYAGMNLSPTFFQDLMRQQNEELDAEAEAKEAEAKAKEAEAKAKAKEAEAEAKAKEAKASSSTGGNKKVKDKYTVKELKAIASRNNIKITKKLNGKTVPLNKKGLFAKLKRNKVI
jgi:uncharacterized protein YqfA (UPF0365 family)